MVLVVNGAIMGIGVSVLRESEVCSWVHPDSPPDILDDAGWIGQDQCRSLPKQRLAGERRMMLAASTVIHHPFPSAGRVPAFPRPGVHDTFSGGRRQSGIHRNLSVPFYSSHSGVRSGVSDGSPHEDRPCIPERIRQLSRFSEGVGSGHQRTRCPVL
jgi:hypothetical protein